MCAPTYDALSAAALPGARVPPDSRLAQSLQSGYFARTFSKWETIGCGGFGTVLKAWHTAEEKWYAVKLVRARARSSETVDDLSEAWGGPDVFKRLSTIKSPHVVRYVRYWSELPSDLPCEVVSRPSSPVLAPANAPLFMRGLEATTSAMSASSGVQSDDGGFEWAPASWPSPGVCGALPGDVLIGASNASTMASPHQAYGVVILEQMEYCEGVTLQTWLSQPHRRPGLSTATPDGVLKLFAQIVKGLTDLHDAGIVHCDVKPANILITQQDAQVKFCDFGSARVRAAAPGPRSGTRAPIDLKELAGCSTALGTPGYAPPEHCTFPGLQLARQLSESCASEGSEAQRCRAACPGSDIFSAGVVLVELLMVSVEAAWCTAMERADALARLRTARGGALPPAVLKEGVPGWLRQLVLRMVGWDAEVRPTAREVLDELEGALWTASRHNPNVGMSNRRSPKIAAMSCPASAAHNPYIGFFLDHRRPALEPFMRQVSV